MSSASIIHDCQTKYIVKDTKKGILLADFVKLCQYVVTRNGLDNTLALAKVMYACELFLLIKGWDFKINRSRNFNVIKKVYWINSDVKDFVETLSKGIITDPGVAQKVALFYGKLETGTRFKSDRKVLEELEKDRGEDFIEVMREFVERIMVG